MLINLTGSIKLLSMDEKSQHIRFAVLIDNEQLKTWQIKCINKLLGDAHNQLVCFIKNNASSNYNPNRLSFGYRLIERQIRKLPLFHNELISDHFKAPKIISVSTHKKGIKTVLDEEEQSKIEDLHLDFILRFGFGIIGGKILDLAKHGVWSFHHGDPQEFRGGPPCFWEFLYGKKSSGFMLQKLNEELDAGEIIQEGRLAVWQHSFFSHISRVFELSTDLPFLASRKIHLNGTLKTRRISKKGKLYKVPGNGDVARFHIKALFGKLNFHYTQLFKGEVWNIGIANALNKTEDKTYVSQIKWMKEAPKTEYYADPFWSDNDDIYFEHYDYRKLKAHLSKAVYKNESWSSPVSILSKKFHLSYPFTQNHEGKNYLLPEQYQSDRVDLYQLTGNSIEKTSTLIKGQWVDSTLINCNERWWLFASPQAYSNECLYLFYADQIEGPYQAHALNPVKIDIRSARSGGKPYHENGQLIRPSQNSENGYGSSLKLNHIKVLSPTEYEEEEITEIFPDPKSKYNEALHTFSKKGSKYVIDGKYTTFIFPSFVGQLKRKMKRIFGLA